MDDGIALCFSLLWYNIEIRYNTVLVDQLECSQHFCRQWVQNANLNRLLILHTPQAGREGKRRRAAILLHQNATTGSVLRQEVECILTETSQTY